MATLASSRQTSGPVQQLTPPSSSHGGGQWDFAVSVDNLRNSYDQEPYMSEYVTSAHSPRQPLTSQANGFAKPVRSPTWGSQDQFGEGNQSHLGPDRVNELHKKPSGDVSTSNSEQDSYQKNPTNARKAPVAAKGKGKKRPVPGKGGPSDPNWTAIEHDQNNWIHRDKLKEIETRELEEAGFRVGRASRSNSRSQSATRRSRDRTNSETTELTQNGDERYEPRKAFSPIPAEDEEVAAEYEAWNSPSQEEMAPELQPASPRTNHNGRPSTSRIPLPRTSGIPVPSSSGDRDAPLQRSRTGSSTWNGDAVAPNGTRLRSGSVGSQALLDDTEDGRQRTPPYGHTRNKSSSSGSPPKSPQKSPMKAKTPGKPAPASGARKTSVQKPQPRNRVASSNSPPKRPGTSGGSVSRPTTSHRPEGEAPWIATMYKPDPRLPPDQQIIPTHAKRMQQEQWEVEGRVGSMYDKDFRLLNNDDMADKRLSQSQPLNFELAQENEAWPLPSPTKKSLSLERIDTNVAKSPTQEQGAYKLTPTIPQGPRALSPKLAPPIEPPQPKPTTIRLPEPKNPNPKDEAPEKNGCCCIVM